MFKNCLEILGAPFVIHPDSDPGGSTAPVHRIRFHLKASVSKKVSRVERKPVIFSDNSHNNEAVMPL